MNLFAIIDQIAKVDPEIYDRLDGRRSAFKYMAGFGKKASMAAVPMALSDIFTKAYGQSTSTPLQVLNYALTLEYLERDFYKAVLDANAIPQLAAGTAARGAIQTIYEHEAAHVTLLKTVIETPTSQGGLGGTPATPTFDLTGGNGSGSGPFAGATSDYATFLAVAQALEDTGVRAYKGQAANLMGNATLLRAALQIHSVEARHAAHIRYMRRNSGQAPEIKPWITGNNANGVPVTAVYAGEENVTHAGVNLTTNTSGLSADAASESFDEPLTMAAVLSIADPFIV